MRSIVLGHSAEPHGSVPLSPPPPLRLKRSPTQSASHVPDHAVRVRVEGVRIDQVMGLLHCHFDLPAEGERRRRGLLKQRPTDWARDWAGLRTQGAPRADRGKGNMEAEGCELPWKPHDPRRRLLLVGGGGGGQRAALIRQALRPGGRGELGTGAPR